MTTSWADASLCPRDQAFTGKVTNRKRLPEGGQLVTLVCPENRCEYHEIGWAVQVRPDGTIPDKIDVNTREKNFVRSPMAATRAQAVRDALAEQALNEQQAGFEVQRF
jgi:hypothetical protein